MDKKLKEKVFKIIESETNITLSDFDPDQDIYEQSALDSVHFVEITLKIEKELNISLPISVLEVNTLNKFMALIEKELK